MTTATMDRPAKQPRPPLNGVDTPSLLGTINVVAGQPELARFTFRSDSEWMGGTHCHSTMKGFTGAGGAQEHKQAFTAESDHPSVLCGQDRGVTPVEHLLHALAGCLTAGIANIAAARGVTLHKVTAVVEGDIDLQAVARETGRPQDRHASLQFALQVDIARGPSDRMLAEVETVLADKFDEWLFPAGPWLLASLGDALMAKGRLDAAGAVLERAYEAADTAGMRGIAGLAARLLTVAHARGGDAEARAELEESLRAEPDIPVWLQTRMRRVLAATAEDDAEAAALLREAAMQARGAGLVPDEARCLAELAARLAAEDPDAAGQAQREAEALEVRMRTPIAAE